MKIKCSVWDHTFLMKCNIYIKKGDLEKALSYIQQGKEMFDSEIKLINTEIDLYMKMGKSNLEIIDKLTQAIEVDDLNEILFIIRAERYISEKMFDLAEMDLLAALDLDPSSKSANNNLASLYLTKTEPLVIDLNKLNYNQKSKIKVLETQIDDVNMNKRIC